MKNAVCACCRAKHALEEAGKIMQDNVTKQTTYFNISVPYYLICIITCNSTRRGRINHLKSTFHIISVKLLNLFT